MCVLMVSAINSVVRERHRNKDIWSAELAYSLESGSCEARTLLHTQLNTHSPTH